MKKCNIGFSCNQASQHSSDIYSKYKPYFSYNDVYFREEIPYAFIGKLRYRLTQPARLLDDVLMVSFDDVKAIYTAKFTFENNNNHIVMRNADTLAHIQAGNKISIEQRENHFELDEIPLQEGDTLWIPIQGLMVKGFKKHAKWMRSYLAPGDYLGISDDGNMFPSVQFLKDLLISTTKEVGILREMYYYDRSKTLEPYRLYLPSTYDPDKKYKMIVWLHGAWPNWHIDLEMDMTNKKFERLAEANDYLLLCVNGYSFGFYGGGSPNLKLDHVTSEEKRCLELCEYEPLCAINAVCTRYSVDREHIYLCGNSMGGAGTFWEAMHHREIFRAIAPCGALTTSDMYQYDWSRMQGLPTLFVCGTENIGYENAAGIVRDLNRLGVDATLCTVPAGIHDDAWIDALEEIFAFFNAN